jgi:hypothetical protein
MNEKNKGYETYAEYQRRVIRSVTGLEKNLSDKPEVLMAALNEKLLETFPGSRSRLAVEKALKRAGGAK